jgi:hypothetical protein
MQAAEAAQSLGIADCQLPISNWQLRVGIWKLNV